VDHQGLAREGSPIYKWSVILVEKSLRQLSSDGILAEVHTSFPLTLKDLDPRILEMLKLMVAKFIGHALGLAGRNLKNTSRWLWLAIAVGKGKTAYTCDDKLKRVSYRLLPCASAAQNRWPRGFAELRDTIVERVRKGSFLV